MRMLHWLLILFVDITVHCHVDCLVRGALDLTVIFEAIVSVGLLLNVCGREDGWLVDLLVAFVSGLQLGPDLQHLAFFLFTKLVFFVCLMAILSVYLRMHVQMVRHRYLNKQELLYIYFLIAAQ